MPLITVHMSIVARGCKVFKWTKEGSGWVCWVWVGSIKVVGTGAIMVKDVVMGRRITSYLVFMHDGHIQS